MDGQWHAIRKDIAIEDEFQAWLSRVDMCLRTENGTSVTDYDVEYHAWFTEGRRARDVATGILDEEESR